MQVGSFVVICRWFFETLNEARLAASGARFLISYHAEKLRSNTDMLIC